MEQTINTFTKGLQSDTHPMMTSNNTLTDCLNGTILTQNGNEIILQNDMGNRRIDNAFLPSGYQPVGMKEYGGIIYVAAYNPITNKSQIGSFPSPERKLSVTDGTFTPVTINNWMEEFLQKDENNNITNSINKDFILKPLTLLNNKEYLSIHPGDKFIVYSDTTLDTTLISNCYNTEGNLITTPKNKLFTLSIGVLNSQNEFVDITSSLARWRHNNICKFTNNESELYKFNYGYFVPIQTHTSGLTQDDQEFKKERESIEANTYSYKLVGPLYLKIQLNHIDKFNYIITGENGNYLKIRYTVEYNCPDYGSTNQESINQYAHINTLSNITDSFIDLYIGDNKFSSSVKLVNSSYNTERNIYSVEYICTYENSNIWTYVDDDILHVKLRPKVKFNNIEYYIKDLEVEEDINVTLLNSNTIEIDEWRFTNDINNKKSTLTYNFNCYPDENTEFSNLQIRFFRVNSDGSISSIAKIKEINGTIYSGRNTVELDWDEIGLDSKALYKVKLYCNRTISYDEGIPLKNVQIKFLSSNNSGIWLRAIIDPEDANVGDKSYYWQASGPNINGQPPIKVWEQSQHTRDCFIEVSRYATSSSNAMVICGVTDIYGKTAQSTVWFNVQYGIPTPSYAFYNQEQIPTDSTLSGNKCIVEDYWFLTTELLNEFYYLSNKEFVPNFCAERASDRFANNDYISDFKTALTVKPNLSPSYSILSDKSEYEGGLIMLRTPSLTENPEINYTRTQNISIFVDGNNIISGEYPDCIYQENPILIDDITIQENSFNPQRQRRAPTLRIRDKQDQAYDIDVEDFGGGGGGTGGSSSGSSSSSNNKPEIGSNISDGVNQTSYGIRRSFEIFVTDSQSIEDISDQGINYINGFSNCNITSDYEHNFFQIGIGFQNQSGNTSNTHMLTIKTQDNIASNSPENTPIHENNWNSSTYTSNTGGNKIADTEIERRRGDGLVRFSLHEYIEDVESFTDITHILYYGFGFCNFISTDHPDEVYHQEFRVGNDKISFDSSNNNSRTETRVWIKGTDGQLALIQNNNNSSFTNTNITNIIKNKLGNIIYLTNNSGELDSNKFIVSNTIESHQVKENPFKYNIIINRPYSSFCVNNSELYEGFKVFLNTEEITVDQLEVTIDSSPFADYLFNYRPNNIRNIYLENGDMVDYQGNFLDPTAVYIEENGKLVKKNLPLRYSSQITIDDKNTLLFYGTNKLSIKQRYDTVGTKQDDSKTYLDYSGINVLDLSEIPQQ